VRRPSPAAGRRYARALLELALASGDPAQLRDELADARNALTTHPELFEALTHPSVGAKQRVRVVNALWEDRGASELFLRLLRLLAERDRVELLPAIADAFSKQWNSHRGVAAAEAVTAVALDDAQTSALASAIKASIGKDVELETRVDPGVLGGVRVLMGGRIYDGTVRGRLKALREQLSGEAAKS
jgi:F-type H+-transporting ATPase subunit delta